jgi:D-methionine transport system substrate-binding protein
VLVLALGILTACGGSSSDEKVIKVAASPTPHAVILNSDAVKNALADEGYTIEVKELDDYVQPNVATTDGDVDANYFQHVPYLDEYNAENGTELVSVANVHYEPMGVYTGSKKSFDELEEGDKICIPNDATNGARALLLLQDNGVIKLREDAGVTATEKDVVENPKNVVIEPLEAAAIPASLEDPKVALGVINANYAIGAGLNIADAIAAEESDSLAAETYVNVIVVNKGNEESEKTKALIAALQTDEVKAFIESEFNGAVVAKF